MRKPPKVGLREANNRRGDRQLDYAPGSGAGQPLPRGFSEVPTVNLCPWHVIVFVVTLSIGLIAELR